MQRYYKTVSRPVSKHMAKAIRQAEIDLDKECERQTDIIYPAGCLALHRRFHWSAEQILEYFNLQEDVYDECGATTGLSMIQMCSDECDIDLMRETSDRDWRDIIYLNPEFDVASLTDRQWLYMRQQQKKWVRPQIMACFILTAKRKYKFTYKQLTDLCTELINIIWDYEGCVSDLKEQCEKEVGFSLTNDPMTAAAERRRK